MELVVHLNSIKFIEEFLDMKLHLFVVGSEMFSCRQALSLSYQELESVKQRVGDKARVYVLVNALVEERYIDDLEVHLHKLHKIGIDGLLFQDFGVLQICIEKNYTFDFMYAPDTLNTNQETIAVLRQQGITSAFLAREIPLSEKIEIQKQVEIPCMMQIHGCEYIAYSKRNLLQNYFAITKKDITGSRSENITIKANEVEDSCHIYEDPYGTHILTKKQIFCLDILSSVQDISYGYIESLYLSEFELVEIVHLYVQGLESINNNTYGKVAKEIVPLLYTLTPTIDYYHSFLFDQTVYKIADVRRREQDENNK